MSRIFEALQKANAELGVPSPLPDAQPATAGVLQQLASSSSDLDQCSSFKIAAVPENRLVAVTDDDGLGAEKTRVLITRLRHLRSKRPISRILITSCMQGEGKSVIAANLAISLAKHSRARTLLIDGDLRKPNVHRLLGFDDRSGIATWWTADVPPQQLLRRADGLPLWVLPAGRLQEQPLEILQSQRFSDLLDQLSPGFEWVIVDSPPCSPLADAAVWASLTDAARFVVRENYTSTKVLTKTLESFDPQKLAGIVVNESSSAVHRYYQGYYGYGYGYGKTVRGSKTEE